MLAQCTNLEWILLKCYRALPCIVLCFFLLFFFGNVRFFFWSCFHFSFFCIFLCQFIAAEWRSEVGASLCIVGPFCCCGHRPGFCCHGDKPIHGDPCRCSHRDMPSPFSHSYSSSTAQSTFAQSVTTR